MRVKNRPKHSMMHLKRENGDLRQFDTRFDSSLWGEDHPTNVDGSSIIFLTDCSAIQVREHAVQATKEDSGEEIVRVDDPRSGTKPTGMTACLAATDRSRRALHDPAGRSLARNDLFAIQILRRRVLDT